MGSDDASRTAAFMSGKPISGTTSSLRAGGISLIGGVVGFGLGFLTLKAVTDSARLPIDYVQAGVLVTLVATLTVAALVFVASRKTRYPLVVTLGACLGVATGSIVALFGPILVIPEIGYVVFAILPAVLGALGGIVGDLASGFLGRLNKSRG